MLECVIITGSYEGGDTVFIQYIETEPKLMENCWLQWCAYSQQLELPVNVLDEIYSLWTTGELYIVVD